MLLGHWQEMKAIGRARGALAALAALLPDEAERVGAAGTTQAVPLSELRVGDVVLVRPGARVPADGHVIDGAAELDESMITGESRPVPRTVSDRVVAGTVATDSAIRVQVDALGEDTALAGIQRMVAQAQQAGGRAQDLADRFAALLPMSACAIFACSRDFVDLRRQPGFAGMVGQSDAAHTTAEVGGFLASDGGDLLVDVTAAVVTRATGLDG